MARQGLSRQVGTALGAVGVVMTGIAAVAIWRMFAVAVDVHELNDKFVEESRICNSIQVAALRTMYEMRGYMFSHDEEVLERAQSSFEDVGAFLSEANALTAKFPDLTVLGAEIGEAERCLKAYEKAMAGTSSALGTIGITKTQMEDAAAVYATNVLAFIDSQNQQFSEELGTSTSPEDLRQRMYKINLAIRIRTVGQDIRISGLKAIIETDPTGLREADSEFDTVFKLLDELQTLTRKQENLKQLEEVRTAANQYRIGVKTREKAVAVLAEAQTSQGDADTNVGTAVLEAAAKTATTAENKMNRLVHASAASLSRTSWGLLAGIVVALLLTAMGGTTLTRRIAEPVREGVGVLASAANEISSTVSQLAASANQTASSIAETTATVDEVRQTAQLANGKAKGVSDSAQSADDAAQQGREASENTVEGMRRIETQTANVASAIMQLSERSQAIGDIISAVSDLAEQSNLLAVNASIEAAKAGEQGKGFAVVAQEIRSLAEQSKEATSKIRNILGEVQKLTSGAVLATEQSGKAVDEGLRQAERTGETIEALAANVEQAAAAATQIAASSQQQLVGMEQVASAMDGIKQASTQNQDSTRQLTVAAENLKNLGLRLRALVEGDRDTAIMAGH